MTLNPKIGVVVIFGSKRVNYNEMDGDRPRLSANRNCYRLWRLSWALAQISCLFYATLLVQGGPKNVPLCLCPCLCHLLTDFQNSFTGTLCRQFAIMWLLYMPPHRKCVSALPCEVSMKYAYITVVTSKHFSRIEKKHFRPTLQRMVYMTLDCMGITQSSVIRIIHRNVGLKRFFHLPKFLLLALVFAYIYISQGSVETRLLCGGIYNNHIIANCLQSVPVKEFWKLVNNWQRYGQK